MKTLLAALLLALSIPVHASLFPGYKSDYFQFVGPNNYHVYDGALFSAKGLQETQNGTVVALITHSPTNGSLLPRSWQNAGYAETWAPLVTGYGNGTGNVIFGPLVNIGPQFQSLVLAGLNYLAPNAFPNAKTFLTNQAQKGAVDITFSFGLLPNIEPIQGGHLVNLKAAFADPVRYFAGPALHF